MILTANVFIFNDEFYEFCEATQVNFWLITRMLAQVFLFSRCAKSINPINNCVSGIVRVRGWENLINLF